MCRGLGWFAACAIGFLGDNLSALGCAAASGYLDAWAMGIRVWDFVVVNCRKGWGLLGLQLCYGQWPELGC